MLRRIVILAAALAVSAPSLARACGGLFCSASAPVVQNAERVVFVDNGDGTITAVIEIVYSGPSSSFSWVLPVSGVPSVSVGSTSLLTTLDAQTRPQIVATRTGTFCSGGGGCNGCDCYAADSASNPGGLADGGVQGGVDVLGGGNVGPYDYVVISVDPGATNQAETARTWLTENGYDVTDAGATVLGEYLAGGQNLIAFRLAKNATTGSIRPIVMTYESTVGVIPIRPTAVAALNDMGVLVFLFGATRAVPISYDEIELSDTAMNWTAFQLDYPAALSAAIDSAGGHAFITESAGPVPTPFDLGALEVRAAHTELVTREGLEGRSLVEEAVLRLRFAEGLVDAMVDALPNVSPAVAQQWIDCYSCIPDSLTNGVDRTAFLEAIEDFVVAPLELSEEIANRRPYLTRLSTTLDPAEMTVDPVFAFASGLPDVALVRTVTARTACVDGSTQVVEVELASGVSYDPGRLDPATPKVSRRLRHDIDGSHMLVADNTAAIDAALLAAAPRDPASRGDSSCATAADDSRASLLVNVLTLALVVFFVRRTRPSRS